MKEREISLLDLIADFLLKWRKILLLMILGAALGGVFGYISNVNTNEAQTVALAEAKEKSAELTEKQAAGTALTADETKKLTEYNKTIETGITVYPGISVKHIVLFAILFAFVYAFIFFMIYVMDNKLKVEDELEELYEIPQLGLITQQKKKAPVFGWVDSLILRMKNRDRRYPQDVKALKLAYVSVKLIVQKQGYEKVTLVGCDIKGLSQHVCDQLKGALEKENIQVEILNDILYDASNMNKLKHAQCIVLIEKAGYTMYKEIYKELDLLKRLEIPVLGGIVVE